MGRIAPGGVVGIGARNRGPVAALALPLVLPLVLAATLAGCLFASETPASSADASGALPTAPSSVAPSPGASPSASPDASPATSNPPPVATKPTPCPGTNRNPGAGPGRQFSGGSTNWAGYVSAIKKTGVTCIEASWIEPTVTCPKTGHQSVAIWIGIDGFGAKTLGIPTTDVLVQIGTQANCSAGLVDHEIWREILPGEANEVHVSSAIHAGDHISAKVSYFNGNFTLALFDQETGFGVSHTAPAPGAPRKTAEWIVEAPATNCPGTCSPLPLPKFTAVRFTGAFVTIAGQRASINDASWSNVKLKMTRGGVTRATVSSLSSGGTAFRVAWAHS